jgi:trehalose synthase
MSLPLRRFASLLDEEQIHHAEEVAAEAARRLAGRTWWHVNSTAQGGGVAEMLHPLLGYVRGLGINARWLVISGNPEFFSITKRLHHLLHGMPGDGGPLGDSERKTYEAVMTANLDDLMAVVKPGDIVQLHDPQTAGLAPALTRHGAIVIWRSHIGADAANEHTDRGWEFLAPYLGENVAATVFSREAYIPDCCQPDQTMIIPPSIDPFSPKNQEMDEASVRAILVHSGLVEGPQGPGEPLFHDTDGLPQRVNRQADIVHHGPSPGWETPLVVQISRWDPLKDPIGVMQGFADLLHRDELDEVELLLAGPNVSGVSDDPEGATTYAKVLEAWQQLPHATRGRVHLVSLPMVDANENAAIVNALQRHAAVIVQKSLREGFGLTVTEAMWKGRPVVGSNIGGIQDQIENGVHGLLIDDPADLHAFGEALRQVLTDPELAAQLGDAARQRVEDEYLGVTHLLRWAEVLERVDTTGA